MKSGSLLVSYFFPSACVACQAVFPFGEEGPFCTSCESQIKLQPRSQCTLCGDAFFHDDISSHVCGECLKDPPPFQKAWSVFELGEVLKKTVHGLKYLSKESTLSWFGKRLTESIQHQMSEVIFDVLMPVPLHTWRLWRRGYNQSLLLARQIQKQSKIPIDTKNLIRVKYEKSQVAKTREERIKSMRGSFAVRNPENLKNKKVLLIDDVYTTGATVRECSKVLKKAGAQVFVLTLARTPLLLKF